MFSLMIHLGYEVTIFAGKKYIYLFFVMLLLSYPAWITKKHFIVWLNRKCTEWFSKEGINDKLKDVLEFME